ncbi:hypothetical protein J1N10_13445 [Carboxylicivirga sp. A043]|uniref:3'(2'),5'-bisphosphate nucleotidase CysQ family protein n=1 Tax=Carboxylicivirga litoralis TaxID=2816963 RepID=UPI0021CB4901|nr:inositol monophosphatase family protein [Carboxylicivirga sp. A043]MCU4156988.1 hypothetical protein [Carboxylicivirga sp. A043]
MKLSSNQLQELCNYAIEAASKAGQLIAQKSKVHLSVNKKNGGESLASQVFTEVDLASEKLILEILQPTINKYDLALLSEETTDDKSRFEKDYFWCIDPLDGTLPFIEQTDGYSVSIALVDKNGMAHIGAIFNPVDGTIYHAIKGFGAFKNHQKWSLGAPDKDYTLICDRSFLKSKNYTTITNQLRLRIGDYKIISHGGAAMNAMWILENGPAFYFKQPKTKNGGGSLWDYAASSCIFNEIEAYAKSFNGDNLDLNRKDSTFMNHKGICYTSSNELALVIQNLVIA